MMDDVRRGLGGKEGGRLEESEGEVLWLTVTSDLGGGVWWQGLEVRKKQGITREEKGKDGGRESGGAWGWGGGRTRRPSPICAVACWSWRSRGGNRAPSKSGSVNWTAATRWTVEPPWKGSLHANVDCQVEHN